jgi:hypothetical protein
MNVALACTHHDPDGRLDAQLRRVLPALSALYAHIAVVATDGTSPRALGDLRGAGASVADSGGARDDTFRVLGRRRREAIALAFDRAPGAAHAHLCDLDRALHWMETYPEELRDVVRRIPDADFTVLGRTERAYATHPRVQRDTEALINHAFGLVWGEPWDVGAASRGLSRRAAGIVAASGDDTIGNDCSWPLCLLRVHGARIAYRATEGLEFETPDRYPAEIAAVGGRDAWIARLDSDPRQWAHRIELARFEVESVARFAAAGGS